MVATAVVGSVVGAGAQAYSARKASKAQAKAGEKATAAQTEANEAAIAEQRRQFDIAMQTLKPYADAGLGSLAAQQNLIGVGPGGYAGQQEAISAIQAGPEYQALVGAGEEAILQNAAATGGLRGGNTQDALAQFRPQVLSQLIGNQFSRLGSISGMGQGSAAGQAATAGQAGIAIPGSIMQGGAIRGAGFQHQGDIAAGRAMAYGSAIGGLASPIGYGIKTMGGF